SVQHARGPPCRHTRRPLSRAELSRAVSRVQHKPGRGNSTSEDSRAYVCACTPIPRWLGCPARSKNQAIPMLEQLRKSGASIFIYVIFGLLIVSFVITF